METAIGSCKGPFTGSTGIHAVKGFWLRAGNGRNGKGHGNSSSSHGLGLGFVENGGTDPKPLTPNPTLERFPSFLIRLLQPETLNPNPE